VVWPEWLVDNGAHTAITGFGYAADWHGIAGDGLSNLWVYFVGPLLGSSIAGQSFGAPKATRLLSALSR